jgi:3-oxoacyl-[acyl-carrier protein] reductase
VSSEHVRGEGGGGHVALVSGASRGLGLAITKAILARAHNKVAGFSRSLSAEADALVKQFPGRFAFKEVDLSDARKTSDLVDSVQDSLGPITVLINNAGMLHEAIFARQDVDIIDRIIDVNLRGTLMLTRYVSRGMMVRQSGRIINISSIVGIRGYKGTVAYSATKGAIDAMTRALARELGGRNVTVNSIAPGYLKTDITASMTEVHLKQIIRRTPLGRLGEVDDVVGLVLFLISPEGSFISGQTIVVDGGLTA